MDELAFPVPPEGMLSEQIDLIGFRMVLGLLHPPSADGIRVMVWDGEILRHLTTAAARKYADEVEAGPYGKTFAALVEGLRHLAQRVDDINTAVIFKRAGRAAFRARKFEDMPVEGSA